MRKLANLLSRRFGLAGLFWLALLLPVAQSIAAGHEISHWRQAQTRQADGDGAPPPHVCASCLAASALGHGGAPAAAALPLPPAGTVQVAAPALAEPTARPWLAGYLCRAPPQRIR